MYPIFVYSYSVNIKYMNRSYQILLDTKDSKNHSVIIRQYRPAGIKLAHAKKGWYIFVMEILFTTLKKKTTAFLSDFGDILISPLRNIMLNKLMMICNISIIFFFRQVIPGNYELDESLALLNRNEILKNTRTKLEIEKYTLKVKLISE